MHYLGQEKVLQSALYLLQNHLEGDCGSFGTNMLCTIFMLPLQKKSLHEMVIGSGIKSDWEEVIDRVHERYF